MRTIVGLALILLAGCGGGAGTDIESTLVFADLSDAEIARLINAAGGTDIFMAEVQLTRLGQAADPCPSVSVEGNVASITGGCATTDGVTIDGSAVVTNPFGWDAIAYDAASPTLYEADGLTYTFSGGATQRYDGVIRRTDSLSSWDADITVAQLGATVRSDLLYQCANPASPSCSIRGGLELVGTGGALVSGSVSVDPSSRRQTLDLTLQGADRLTVHGDGTCIGWSIEGTDRGMTCP